MLEIENCYFYEDKTVPFDKRHMSVLCLDCSKKPEFQKIKEDAWFWDALWHLEVTGQGYGPFKFQCEKCKKIVYDGSQKTSSTD